MIREQVSFHFVVVVAAFVDISLDFIYYYYLLIECGIDYTQLS